FVFLCFASSVRSGVYTLSLHDALPILVVFYAGEDVGAEVAGDFLMDDGVVGGGVFSHEVHGGEILLALLSRKIEPGEAPQLGGEDRKSTRLNSSHVAISYAVFCLKKKK